MAGLVRNFRLRTVLSKGTGVFSRVSSREVSVLHNRDYLKEKLVKIVPEARQKLKDFKKLHKDVVIDKVTVDQVLGGMRGIKCMFHEGSLLDPELGIRLRGHSVFDCKEKLPKAPGSEQPLPEGVFWLLLTGEIPNESEVEWLSSELARRAELPYHIVNVLGKLPDDLHPMAQLSACLCLLSRFSKFSVAYNTGVVKKEDLWKPMYEDCMNLVAKVPVIAAKIYRNCYHDGEMPLMDMNKDWAHNYVQMLGIKGANADFVDFMRLYLSIHSDHEGGNVSSHAAHLVGSALSDAFLSFSAAINGLAGPLHGRANQEVVEWIDELVQALGADGLTEEKVRDYCTDYLTKGVIPGYGHAVLRKTDPRYTIQLEFAKKHLPDSPILGLIEMVYKIVPKLLSSSGRVKNPWANVDAISGSLLGHYGLTEADYYTVPFGVSRSLGVAASLIWDRALNLPLERPKSLDLASLEGEVKKTK